jgi:hypothetical protein
VINSMITCHLLIFHFTNAKCKHPPVSIAIT